MTFFDQALAQFHRLPAIPAVVQKVMASFDSPNLDLNELTAKISQDPVLTGRLLRVANSPFYGFPRKIASIHDAVVIMGLSGVRSLVLSAGFMAAFEASKGSGLDRAEYWKRCFRVASFARAIAGCLRQPQETAFTAGMLHDIGELVLDICLPEQYAAALRRAEANLEALIAAEEALLGFHHGTLGAEVARRWNFPQEIEQSIRDCRAPHGNDLPALSMAVCMAVRLDEGEAPASLVEMLPISLREELELDAGQLAAALPDRQQLESRAATLLE